MTIETEERSIRILTFLVKEEDWDMWSKKFLAMAVRKKYKKILLGDIMVPKENAT